MEKSIGGFVFFSTFDSGNLGRVELADDKVVMRKKSSGAGDKGNEADRDDAIQKSSSSEGLAATTTTGNKKTKGKRQKRKPLTSSVSSDVQSGESIVLPEADKAFDIWTKPDCAGTEFENGNRTWFYFGVMRDPESVNDGRSTYTIRLTIRNLNKQSKLFSQGMVPVCLTHNAKKSIAKLAQLPAPNHQWERIRETPVYWTEDGNFVISFRVKIDVKHVTYLAFTYPYTYKELQIFLDKLDKRHSMKHLSYSDILKKSQTSVYFHRDVVCKSLEGRNVDLITLTGVNDITEEREPNLENLYPDTPDQNSRPFKFENKKIVFVSARVHPGETQSSFVINGLIKFLLRDNDPRAMKLMKKYVFKLIPMLNPDGVVKGHYRTDSRGVNLNRVYQNPQMDIHPTIYAARKLLLYSHYGYEVFDDSEKLKLADNLDDASSLSQSSSSAAMSRASSSSHFLRSSMMPPEAYGKPSNDSEASSSQCFPWYEMTETSRFSEGDESIADFSYGIGSLMQPPPEPPLRLQPSSSGNSIGPTSFKGALGGFTSPKRRLNPDSENESSSRRPLLSVIPPSEETQPSGDVHMDLARKLANTIKGEQVKDVTEQREPLGGKSHLFVYVDIHGHASKRGIFMYGNHFKDLDAKIDSMLLPKLMSLNCANFDFPACNFTEKNMYLKDRHTGAGREGSGRVSAFKATGLIYSYTLECNFNSGRIVNSVPMASRDAGRATPPPNYDSPPKYDPVLFEDAGKGMAVSILDLTESNPWTRMTCSASKNLKGVRESIKKFIKQSEERSKKDSSDGSLTRASTRSSTQGTALKSAGNKSSQSKPTPALNSDSYRPVSKVPRKSATPRNSQGFLTESSKLVMSRSKSAAGGTGSSLVQAIILPAEKRSSSKPFRQTRSTPNSRPTSPMRKVSTKGTIQKAKKKVKKTPTGSVSSSRRTSTASTSTVGSQGIVDNEASLSYLASKKKAKRKKSLVK